MKKPSEVLMKLAALGGIRGIIIEYRQTGTDTCETYCELLGHDNRKIGGLWSTYRDYLDVQVDWASAAKIKQHYIKEYEDWIKFEKANAKELSEYERLKAKFE